MATMTESGAIWIAMPFLRRKLQEMAESEIEETSDMTDAAYDAFQFGKETAARALAALPVEAEHDRRV